MEHVTENYCVEDSTKHIVKWDVLLWSVSSLARLCSHLLHSTHATAALGKRVLLVQQLITPYHL